MAQRDVQTAVTGAGIVTGDRMDVAEAPVGELLSLNSEIAYELMDAHRMIGVLWKSRRMWQERALEAEGSARLAQANARWQLAHVERLEAARAEQATETLTDGLKAMLGTAEAEAKLTAVLTLHATVDARWSSEGPDVKRCRHCGQLAPCDTALVVGE